MFYACTERNRAAWYGAYDRSGNGALRTWGRICRKTVGIRIRLWLRVSGIREAFRRNAVGRLWQRQGKVVLPGQMVLVK